jgi:nucleoside phosphorylase
MLPKVDPPIRVFDARNKRFVYALTVGERGVYREPGALVGDQVDLLVLVALAEEFEQLAALLPKTEAVPDAVHGGCDYLCTLPAKERPVRVALRLVGAMGIGEAQLTADRSIERWKPKAAVWLGIAAGIHNDLRLCDVVVPDQVDAFDANLKAVPDGEDGYTFQERGAVFHGDHALVSAIGQLQFSHREDYEGWRLAGGADLATEVAATLRKEFGPLLGEAPRVKVGHIASGSVVGAAPAFLARLRKRDGTLLALEMETAGLARAAVKRATSTRFLAIRGVSDRGDADKTLLDKVGDGALRRVAMRNAVRLFLLLVRVGSIPHDRQ